MQSGDEQGHAYAKTGEQVATPIPLLQGQEHRTCVPRVSLTNKNSNTDSHSWSSDRGGRLRPQQCMWSHFQSSSPILCEHLTSFSQDKPILSPLLQRRSLRFQELNYLAQALTAVARTDGGWERGCICRMFQSQESRSGLQEGPGKGVMSKSLCDHSWGLHEGACGRGP